MWNDASTRGKRFNINEELHLNVVNTMYLVTVLLKMFGYLFLKTKHLKFFNSKMENIKETKKSFCKVYGKGLKEVWNSKENIITVN